MPRVLPDDLGADIDLDAWPLLPVFQWLAQTGGMDQAEMLKTFNCGLGMILSVSPDEVDALETLLQTQGESVYRIGSVTKGAGVRYTGRLL